MSVHYRQHDVGALTSKLVVQLGGKKATLAKRLGISVKTLGRMCEGEPGHADIANKVYSAAHYYLPPHEREECRVAPEPPLWDPELSYDENLRRCAIEEDRYPTASELPVHPTKVWEFELDSCFGASASPLTANHRRAMSMFRLGASVVTLKTVRTQSRQPHHLPKNLAYVTDPAFVSDFTPEARPSRVRVDGGWRDLIPGQPFCLVNCFGIPSVEPASWQADLRACLQTIPIHKMLVVSVVGSVPANTSGQRESERLIESDFVRCVELVLEAAVDSPLVIELNLSCPNTFNLEHRVSESTGLAGRICQAARRAIDKSAKRVRLLAKVSYMPDALVQKFCGSTAEFLDGYSAINSIPVEVVRNADGREDAYFTDKFPKAGLSGIAILHSAVQTVKSLRDWLDRHGRSDAVIFGMGGVASPEHVRLFRTAGASIVQATTAFQHDPMFASKVRQSLVPKEPSHGVLQTRAEREQYLISLMRGFPAVRDWLDLAGGIRALQGDTDQRRIEAFVQMLQKLSKRNGGALGDQGDLWREPH